jgi:hypothetical protein
MTRKLYPFAWLCLVSAAIFFSCAGAPRVSETPPNPPVSEVSVVGNPPMETKTPMQEISAKEKNPVAVILSPELVQETPVEEKNVEVISQLAAANIPKRPAKPEVPEFIMGEGLIIPEVMSAFLLGANPGAEREFVKDLAFIYIEESAVEGVNHDTAFAQMCLETGFLSFTGLVTPDQNNFCGLGSIGPGQPGERFSDPRTGVRAHIQHLKAYATDTPLKQDLVDPRYHYVRYGSSPAIRGLSGTWAADRQYADKIANILERLYDFAFEI